MLKMGYGRVPGIAPPRTSRLPSCTASFPSLDAAAACAPLRSFEAGRAARGPGSFLVAAPALPRCGIPICARARKRRHVRDCECRARGYCPVCPLAALARSSNRRPGGTAGAIGELVQRLVPKRSRPCPNRRSSENTISAFVFPTTKLVHRSGNRLAAASAASLAARPCRLLPAEPQRDAEILKNSAKAAP